VGYPTYAPPRTSEAYRMKVRGLERFTPTMKGKVLYHYTTTFLKIINEVITNI
jgi:hypothetical protein